MDRMLDSIKKKMDSYEESVPEGLWDDIVSSVSVPEPSRKRVAIMPWVWSTLAAAAVAAVVVFLSVNHPSDTLQTISDNLSVVGQDNPATSHPNPSSSVQIEEVRTADDDHCAEKGSQARLGSLVAQATVVEGDVQGHDVPDEPEEVELAEDETRVAVPDDTDPVDSEILRSVPHTTHDDEDWSGRMSASRDGRHHSSLIPESAGAVFSGALTQSQMQSVFDPKSLYHGAPQSSGEGEQEATQSRPLKKVPASRIPTVTTDTKHYRPIRVAALARWKFNDLLGVETGVAWTLLGSKFTTSSGDLASTEDRQALQYIGIPLNLSASFLNGKTVSMYASGGGMAEKCVSAVVRHREYVSDSKVSSSSDRISVDPLLWSVNAGLGVQANVMERFGIFLEPGLSYHFNDGSDVQTIYKEHPLDFMMTFGLRVSFR